MMNIRTLGSKGSVGIKYKDDISTKLCVKLWFESDWYFCNITESGWFWKRLSRNKVPNNHFLKSAQKEPYADVLQGVVKNFVTVKHLCWSLFLIKLMKRLQHRCFPVNNFLYRNLKLFAFVSLINNCSVLGHLSTISY